MEDYISWCVSSRCARKWEQEFLPKLTASEVTGEGAPLLCQTNEWKPLWTNMPPKMKTNTTLLTPLSIDLYKSGMLLNISAIRPRDGEASKLLRDADKTKNDKKYINKRGEQARGGRDKELEQGEMKRNAVTWRAFL